MKNKVVLIGVLCILLAGIGLIAYPSFSDFINRQFAYRTITEYRDTVGQKDREEMKAEIERARRYNEVLADQQREIGISMPSEERVAEMAADGRMLGYIQINAIDVYCPIYFGTSEEVLNKGIGVAEYSSLPVGGASTHSVLAGHSGLSSKKLFTDIDQLKKGDLIFIHILDQSFAYRVEQSEVVLPSDTEKLKIREGGDEITLLTCTPYGVNTHRLLVRAERTAYDFTEKEIGQVQKEKEDWLWAYTVLACAGAGIVWAVCRKRKKKKGEV